MHWNTTATPPDFFTGKLANPMFIQVQCVHTGTVCSYRYSVVHSYTIEHQSYDTIRIISYTALPPQAGAGFAAAPDQYLYIHFPAASNPDTAYWDGNDYILLGRVPAGRILDRSAYEFYTTSNVVTVVVMVVVMAVVIVAVVIVAVVIVAVVIVAVVFDVRSDSGYIACCTHYAYYSSSCSSWYSVYSSTINVLPVPSCSSWHSVYSYTINVLQVPSYSSWEHDDGFATPIFESAHMTGQVHTLYSYLYSYSTHSVLILYMTGQVHTFYSADLQRYVYYKVVPYTEKWYISIL
jgi:hypothetical protein